MKKGKWIGIGFFGIILILGFTLYFKMQRALPSYGESLTYPELQGVVEIHTDSYGIPHIFADSKEDLYFGLGYAQGRERYFQLQILKRVVSGRLSEVVGEKGIKVDTLFRHVGLRRNSIQWIKENISSSPPEAVLLIDKYLLGLNKMAEKPLPVEFFILGLEAEPITREDILAFVGFMGFGFGEGIHSDPLISELEAEWGKEMIEEITGEISSIALVTPDSLPAMRQLAIQSLDLKNLMREIGLPLFQGSNSWVVSPSKSKSKKALFSNDPHIGFSNPSIWFEAYLESPGFQIYGHFLPLVPFAPVGFNKNYAWGLTMFENDDMDFYLEKDNPANPDEYFHQGKLLKYKITEETIKVKFGKDIPIRIKESIHGPVLSGVAKSMEKTKSSIAMKWPMYDKMNNPLNTFYGFNFANSITDFDAASQHLLVPGLNVVYADSTGNIAYFPCGVIPTRNFSSDRILDGESGKYEWGANITGSARPKSINPPRGFIFTANHKHYGNVPYKIQGYWQADDRSSRINARLTEKNEFSMEDMKDIILDDKFDSASYILPILKPILESQKDSLSSTEKSAYEILFLWDQKGNPKEAGALIFSELRIHLMRELFLDELGEERFNILADTSRLYHYLKKVYPNSQSPWWDNHSTPKKETREDILILAFKNTIKSIQSKQGSNPESWKWGKEHTLLLKHALGDLPILGSVFNSGPREVAGGSETVNNLLSKISKGDHKVTAGPSMRTQIDFGDPNSIQIINPLGESGHRLSPHFQDQADLYARGEFRTLSLEKMKTSDKNRTTILSSKKKE